MCARAREMMAVWPSSYHAARCIKVNWFIVTFFTCFYRLIPLIFKLSPLQQAARSSSTSFESINPRTNESIENRSNHEIPHLRRHLNKEIQPSYLTVLCATHAPTILSLLVSGGALGIMFLPLFSPDHDFQLNCYFCCFSTTFHSEGDLQYLQNHTDIGAWLYSISCVNFKVSKQRNS